MIKGKLEEISNLMDDQLFKEAESSLLDLLKKKEANKYLPYINYQLGYIYHVNLGYEMHADKTKFKGSKEKVKKFLGKAIDSDKPIEDGFWRLADVEENKQHAIRILRKGLESFPHSKSIYQRIISKLNDDEVLEIYEEIKTKNVFSNEICHQLYHFFLKKKNYSEVLVLIDRYEITQKQEKDVLQIIKAFCFYELSDADKTNLKKAKDIFAGLMDSDINQDLNYSQYIGLTLCLIKQEEGIEKIAKIVDEEIPYELSEDLFIQSQRGDRPGFVFEDYQCLFINHLIDLFKSVKEYKKSYAKIRAVRGFMNQNIGTCLKKTVGDLKFAQKNLSRSQIIDTGLASAYYYADHNLEAFKQDYENVVNYDDKYESEADRMLSNLSNAELIKAVTFFIKKIHESSSWYKDKFKDIMESMVNKLHEKEYYKYVANIGDCFPEEILKKTSVLFKIAYAYNEGGNKSKAKIFYEEGWKNNKTSSLANNLALLYEDEGDLIHALELLKEAKELNSDDEIAKKNFDRVNKAIKGDHQNIKNFEIKQQKALENLKEENVYIHQKLLFLIENENEDYRIEASRTKLKQILKAGSVKVEELITQFQEKNYIFKVIDHDIDTMSNVYRLDSSVRNFILKQEDRIEENKPLLTIGERINLDNFEKLGFDKNIISKIDKKVSDEKLREILKRDLRENALALLTESYKTALVLSGSIIESLVLNKIYDHGIEKHFPNAKEKKEIRVVDMNLSELLYVCDKNKILDVQTYHFSQGIRGYRNFIHPAVEIRKGKNNIDNITSEDANLAWGIVKKVLNDI